MASITVSAESVVKGFLVLNLASAVARWRWAQQLRQLADNTADKKGRAELFGSIGKTIGEAVRGKAYSGHWARAHVSAAEKWQSEPKTDSECQAFLDACNNVSKAKAEKGAADKADFLRMLKSAAKSALKHGADRAELEAALAEAVA